MGLDRLEGYGAPEPGGDKSRRRTDKFGMIGADKEEVIINILRHALEGVTDALITQAIRSILEERRLGEPGPEFELFQDELVFYLKVDRKNRLEMLLAGRLVFLLAAATTMIDGAQIDPNALSYEDPGPLAGTDDDPRKHR